MFETGSPRRLMGGAEVGFFCMVLDRVLSNRRAGNGNPAGGKGVIMYPVVPADAMAGVFEMVCCFFTVLAAFVSYLLTLRF